MEVVCDAMTGNDRMAITAQPLAIMNMSLMKTVTQGREAATIGLEQYIGVNSRT